MPVKKPKTDADKFFRDFNKEHTESTVDHSRLNISTKRLLLKQLPLSNIITKDNIRSNISLDTEFIDSIRNDGLLQSLHVSFNQADNNYILISGHRRYAALKLISQENNNSEILVPCMIEQEIPEDIKRIKIQFSENKQRKDLSTEDELNALSILIEAGMKQNQISEFLNLSKSYVSRILKINSLDDSDKTIALNLPKTVAAEYADAPSEIRKSLIEKNNITRSDIRNASKNKSDSSNKTKKETSIYNSKRFDSSDEDFYVIIGIKGDCDYNLDDCLEFALQNLKKFK